MNKKHSLLKLWNSFPSLLGISDEQAGATLGEWNETVAPYSDAIVEAAITALRRRNVAFAPSAGQIRAECEKAAADASLRDRVAIASLPPPTYSEEYRADMKRRFDALVMELRSGANFNPRYGERPRGHRPEKPIVNRVVPRSWLEEWERQNKRPYPARAAVRAALKENPVYREAAE